jgi:hypothetical protein
VENLESRIALSKAGTWTELLNPMPGSGSGSGEMLLLSDGSVMVQGGGAGGLAFKDWYRLTPDSHGDYADGTWSRLAPMVLPRLDYAAVTLPDGDVMVLGGEYTPGVGSSPGDNSEADSQRNPPPRTNETEIYDPVANTWTVTAPVPEPKYGDEPAVVLPGGTVITSAGFNTNTYIYDPATNTWSTGPQRPNGDTGYEENWLTLPGGRILAVPTQGLPLQSVQELVPGASPSQDRWIGTGVLPAVLSYGPPGDYAEMGPGFLLPDGRVWQVGGNSLTAIDTAPSARHPYGVWKAGPTLPTILGNILTGADAVGAMMPNGEVIVDASPWLRAPTYFFLFNPRARLAKSLTPLSPPGSSDPHTPLDIAAWQTSFLVLPTGQILYDQRGNPDLWVYTPGGSPRANWRPTITSVTPYPNGSTFLLRGRRLNGMSEGAAPGDNGAWSTNFPVVRLTSANGTVTYAPTKNWAVGVQAGAALQSTEFTLPAGLPGGRYKLQVIASGIASRPYEFLAPGGPPGPRGRRRPSADLRMRTRVPGSGHGTDRSLSRRVRRVFVDAPSEGHPPWPAPSGHADGASSRT